jgi:hypothetical protein
MGQLTFLLEAPPARPSPSPADERDWMTHVVTWPSSFFSLLADSAPVGWFGRTCPEFLATTAVRLSPPSSGSWSNAGMASPTESSTLSLRESPKDAVASSLSAILETGDHLSRYFLSARACKGILTRAERRGRRLPLLLREALEATIQRSEAMGLSADEGMPDLGMEEQADPLTPSEPDSPEE